MDAQTHLAMTHARLTTSQVVFAYVVLEERLGLDYGYLRVRVELANHDFLEMAEYFVISKGAFSLQRYCFWRGSPRHRRLDRQLGAMGRFLVMFESPDRIPVGGGLYQAKGGKGIMKESLKSLGGNCGATIYNSGGNLSG
jgi:hypothetical protein